MAKSATARALSRFRQLSSLRLGGDRVMPALIAELHTLVPSLRALFFFADARGELRKVYSESPEHAATTQLYLEEFHGRPDREVPGQSYADAMRSQVGVYDLAAMRVEEGAFERTDFYNLLFRPVGRAPDYIRLVMRDRGRGLGMITVFRGPGDKHFSAEEKRRLASLEPFFVHALKDKGTAPLAYSDSGEGGIIVADREGRLKHASATARTLLYRAMCPMLTPGSVRLDPVVLPPVLRALCATAIHAALDGSASAPPAHDVVNELGRFTFRAHLLDEASGLVGIAITHEQPLPIKLAALIAALPLSVRQAEVCLHVASGLSNEAIAERLGVSRNTAIAHRRWLYDRLDVHNRTELVDCLLRPIAAASH